MRLRVKIVPAASRDEIAGWLGDALKVRVRALPERGRANAAMVRVIADALAIPSARIRVIGGHATPHKTLELDDLSEAAVHRCLAKPDSVDSARSRRR